MVLTLLVMSLCFVLVILFVSDGSHNNSHRSHSTSDDITIIVRNKIVLLVVNVLVLLTVIASMVTLVLVLV